MSGETRRARVLRPVSRQSPADSPASFSQGMSPSPVPPGASMLPQSLRTNRVFIQQPMSNPGSSSNLAALANSSAPVEASNTNGAASVSTAPSFPKISQEHFALKVRAAIQRMRDVMLKRERSNLSTDETVRNLREIEKLYNELEKLTYSVSLDQRMPAVPREFMSLISERVDNTRMLSKVTEGMMYSERLEGYTSGLLETSVKLEYLNFTKPICSLKVKPPSLSNGREAHKNFIATLRHVLGKKDVVQQMKLRIYTPVIISCDTAIVEVDMGRRKDHNFVPFLKVAILIQNGSLSMLKFGSVKERLVTINKDIVDSQHEVFRQITAFASGRLQSSSVSSRLSGFQPFLSILSYMQFFTMVFSTPCISCKKLMNDFLPPVRLLDANPNRPQFQHVSCQHLPTGSVKQNTF